MARPKNTKAEEHIRGMISRGNLGTVFSAADIQNRWYANGDAPDAIHRVTIVERLKELAVDGLIEKIGNCYQRKGCIK